MAKNRFSIIIFKNLILLLKSFIESIKILHFWNNYDFFSYKSEIDFFQYKNRQQKTIGKNLLFIAQNHLFLAPNSFRSKI